MTVRIFAMAGVVLCCWIAAAATAAQSPGWTPSRPVAFIAGSAAGGSLDLTARTLQRIWEQSQAVKLNSLLPPDIVIRKVEEGEENFHARKSPRSKIYEYRILNEPVRSPFQREYAWHLPTPLNWGEMKRATKKLIGQQDFSSFRSAGSSAKTSVRKVVRAEWKHSRDGLVRFEIEANGFLKQMVRAIVGTLVEVGKGKISPAQFQKIIEAKDRKEAGRTAPARGLFHKEVKNTNLSRRSYQRIRHGIKLRQILELREIFC